MAATIKPRASEADRVRVGVSACLLGQAVRYDGGHKRQPRLTAVLGALFELVPVCPELEVGMGVPREPLRLVGAAAAPRLVGTASGEDWTGRMGRYAERRVASLLAAGLSGFVLKRRSPSCGTRGVKLYPRGWGRPARRGVGLFARALAARAPLLPVEDVARLGDARARERFVVRVFAYHRLELLFRGRWTVPRLAAFHAAQAAWLAALTPAGEARLRRLVARARELPRAELRDRYRRLFMGSLPGGATPPRRA